MKTRLEAHFRRAAPERIAPDRVRNIRLLSLLSSWFEVHESNKSSRLLREQVSAQELPKPSHIPLSIGTRTEYYSTKIGGRKFFSPVDLSVARARSLLYTANDYWDLSGP